MVNTQKKEETMKEQDTVETVASELPQSTLARVDPNYWPDESPEIHALSFMAAMRGRMEAILQLN